MVFPLADDNRDRASVPWVTISLIAINIFVFVVLQGVGNNDDFTYAFSTVPAEIVMGKDIETEGEPVQVQTQGGVVEVMRPGLRRTPIPVYLTLITSMFMHGGIAHLAGNMWFLWIFGDNIEDDLGKIWYVVFYLGCGLAAGLAHVLLNTSSLTPCLGASGAISGVMGAYIVLHPHRQVTVLMFRFVTQVPGYVAVGIWFGFQLLESFGALGSGETGIAYAAHIGGFLAGAAIAGGVRLIGPRPPESKGIRESYGRGVTERGNR